MKKTVKILALVMVAAMLCCLLASCGTTLKGTYAAEALTIRTAYTFDGKQMFWSEKYNAYAYLLIANIANAGTEKSKIGIIATETVKTVDYSGDVNMAANNVVDINDAQLVYNMYATKMYKDFDTVSVEKFLRADVNGDTGMNVQDARWIVNSVLGISNN